MNPTSKKESVSASASERALQAARHCESAGLLAEADILYRLAVTLQIEHRAMASASLARVLLAEGRMEDARLLATDGDDPVLMAILAFESHKFAEVRRLLDEARERDPFDPRSASVRGRLFFLEKRFQEAVADLLEAALLRPGGLPDATDARFLRAAKALAPGQVPGWKDAATAARQRLEARARQGRPDLTWPDHVDGLVRVLVARGSQAEGLLDRAQRLSQIPALVTMTDHALLAAAAGGELRQLAAGSTLYRTGDLSPEVSFIVAGRLELVRDTPVGPQPMGESSAGEFVGEETLVQATRVSDARASGPVTLLGFPADFLFENPDRAPWLRHLRVCLARRLARLNGFFEEFFPRERPSPGAKAQARAEAPVLSAEEKSRSLTSGGLSESDRVLFAAFAQERQYPAEALIFREGDAGDALYVIARGRVRISRQIAGGEEAFAILTPGGIFGEMAILDPQASGRSADARAHEDVLLLELTRSRFQRLEAADPEGCADLSALLCRLAARRCVETAERLARWRIMAGPG